MSKLNYQFTQEFDFGFKGKWISAVNLKYKNKESGEIRNFEAVGRPQFSYREGNKYKVRKLEDIYGGVNVIPISICPKSGQKIVLLEVIHRIPTQRYVISFPAGFQDNLEDPPSKTALRELKEETGYIGNNPREILRHWTDPWKSCDRSATVYADIDLTLKENQNPQPEVEFFENITPFWVPVKGLKHSLSEICKENDFDVDGRLHSWAEGIDFASNL